MFLKGHNKFLVSFIFNTIQALVRPTFLENTVDVLDILESFVMVIL